MEKKKKEKKLEVRLEEERADALIEIAKAAGVKRSSLIREIIDAMLIEFKKNFSEYSEIRKQTKQDISAIKKNKGKISIEDIKDLSKKVWNDKIENIEKRMNRNIAEKVIEQQNKKVKENREFEKNGETNKTS